MSGAPVKNFRMFRRLCGERALQNVVIVTNMWEGVDPQVGEEREAELKGKDIFFKPALEFGAQMARHENTAPSAEDILRLLLPKHPLPLCIQTELVRDRKDITETMAGEELNRELNVQIKKHKEEMRILKEDMEEAMKDKDEETRRILGAEAKKLEDSIEKLEDYADRLASDYQRGKQELEARLAKAEEEARWQEEAQRKAEVEEVKWKAEADVAKRKAKEAKRKTKEAEREAKRGEEAKWRTEAEEAKRRLKEAEDKAERKEEARRKAESERVKMQLVSLAITLAVGAIVPAVQVFSPRRR